METLADTMFSHCIKGLKTLGHRVEIDLDGPPGLIWVDDRELTMGQLINFAMQQGVVPLPRR